MSEYKPLLINEDDIAKREEAITNIHQELLDVNEIFKMLAQLSHEQGHLIDNIEQNIDDVVINVEHADRELDSASKKQQSRNKCLWSILIILLIIFLILVIVLIITLK